MEFITVQSSDLLVFQQSTFLGYWVEKEVVYAEWAELKMTCGNRTIKNHAFYQTFKKMFAVPRSIQGVSNYGQEETSQEDKLGDVQTAT